VYCPTENFCNFYTYLFVDENTVVCAFKVKYDANDVNYTAIANHSFYAGSPFYNVNYTMT
jgi:hypothetical protein